MAALNTQIITAEPGSDLVMNVCAAGGDTIDHVPGARILIENADAASKTVTFVPFTTTVIGPEGNLTRGNIVCVVPASARRMLEMPPAIFADASGRVSITYSAVTSLRISSVAFS